MNAAVPISETKAPNAFPRTRRGRALRDALPLFVTAVARQCGAEVVFGDWPPHRVNSKIFLPNLPFDDPSVEVLAMGFTWHELAHVLRDRESGSCTTKSDLQEGLRNLLQDAVDERFLGRRYPGSIHRLHQMVKRLVETGDFARPTANDPPLAQMQNYLLYRLRAALLGQSALADYAAQAEALVRDTFPSGACVRIGSVIGRVPSVRTRQEVADLAQEIVDIIQEESEDPPPKGGSDANDDNESASGDGNDTHAASNDNIADDAQIPSSADTQASVNGAQPRPDTNNDAPDIDTAEATRRANLRSLLDASADDFGPDLSDVLGDALNEEAAGSLQTGCGGGVGLATAPLSFSNVAPERVLADVAHATIALRTRLSALVESSREDDNGDYCRHGTRPDPRRFVAALCGDPRIFREEEEERDVNTRVVWLLDRSSSMAEQDRMSIAKQSVLAAAVTLETIQGISQTVAAFPGDRSEITVLTPFTQSVRHTAGYYHGIFPSGGTPALAALMWGIDQLLQGPEPRKLLMMVTDGEPPLEEVAPFKDMVRRCWEAGIEACGIGIRVPDIRELFPMSRSVHTLEDLAPAMFDLLQEILTRRTLS